MPDNKTPIIRNEELLENQEDWKLALLSFEGGRKYIKHCLLKHSKEGIRKFERRKRQAYYVNFTDKFINVFLSFIQGSVTRNLDLGPDVSDMYLDKIDLFSSADKFFKRRLTDYMLTGNALVMADAYEGNRAYLHNINILNILDFKVTGAEYEYVDVWLNNKVIRCRPDVIQKTSIENYNKKIPVFTEEIPNSIGRIPIVTANGYLDASPAYFRDAVLVCRNIFEQMNSVAFQYTENAFSIFAHPPRKKNALAEQLEPYDPADPLRISQKDPNDFDPHEMTHITISEREGILPQWISPSTEHLASNLNFILSQIGWLMLVLNIYNENKAISGDAKSYDYSLMVGALNDMANVSRDLEMNSWWLLAQYDDRIKNNWDKILIQYPNEFDLKSLKTKLEEIILALSQSISPTLDAQLKKQIAEMYEKNDDILKKIYEEINNYKEPVIVDPTGIFGK